jgi:putative membrane protein
MFETKMKSFLLRWIISTVAVLVATYIVPGIDFQKPLDLLVATLLLGILNTFLRPLLLLLSLPLLVFTLGLFMLVINALLLLLVSVLLQPNFAVDGFWSAFWGALVISIITLALNSLTGTGNSRISVKRGKAPPRDDGNGPVIDV